VEAPKPIGTTIQPIEQKQVKLALAARRPAAGRGNVGGMQVDSMQNAAIPKRTTVTVDTDSDSDGYTQVKRQRATSTGGVVARGRPRDLDRPEKGNQSLKTILKPSQAPQL
jgi:hypothetical protein